MEIWKDKNGNVINIGPWDLKESREPVHRMVRREVSHPVMMPAGRGPKGDIPVPMLDAYGDPIIRVEIEEHEVTEYETVQQNPLPDGAYRDEAEIEIGRQGGRYLRGDPRIRQEDEAQGETDVTIEK